jgi:hypothetical protein
MTNPEAGPSAENQERAQVIAVALENARIDVKHPEVQAFIERASQGAYDSHTEEAVSALDAHNSLESMDDPSLIWKLGELEHKKEDAAAVKKEIERRGLYQFMRVGESYDSYKLKEEFLVRRTEVAARGYSGTVKEVLRTGWKRPDGSVVQRAEIIIAV